MTAPDVRLCRDCQHSIPEPKSEWVLRCMHPEVNKKDPWALSGAKPHGSSAREERSRTWTMCGPAPCGMRGRLWEQRYTAPTPLQYSAPIIWKHDD